MSSTPLSDPLTLVTDNPIETLWEQLSAYESNALAKKLILKKTDGHNEVLKSTSRIEQKSTALSYCIRTAREYIRIPTASMTTKTTANYYGCLWLASAIAVADPNLEVDLSIIEKSTKGGHGLGNGSNDSGHFPANEYVFVKKSGFLADFLSWTGTTQDQINELCGPSKQLKKADPNLDTKNHLVPLLDLFARIPELIDVYEEVTGLNAQCFEIFSAPSQLNLPPEAFRAGIFTVGIRGNYSKEHLLKCNLPLNNLAEYKNKYDRGYFLNSRWAGEIANPSHQDIWRVLFESPKNNNFYTSPLSGHYFISPLLKHILDPLIIHLMLSYQLSILARYRPAVWREIIEGKLDQYRVLITTYNRIFPRILLHLVLHSLLGRRVRTPIPGTFI